MTLWAQLLFSVIRFFFTNIVLFFFTLRLKPDEIIKRSFLSCATIPLRNQPSKGCAQQSLNGVFT